MTILCTAKVAGMIVLAAGLTSIAVNIICWACDIDWMLFGMAEEDED